MRIQTSIRSSSIAAVRTWAPACLVAGIAASFAAPAGAQSCIGDLNGKGGVDGSDLAIVLGGWGPCSDCLADITDDGIVDGNDLAIVLGHWGPCPPPPFATYSMQKLQWPAIATTNMGPSATLVDLGLTFNADLSAPRHATPVAATRFAIWAQSVPAINPFTPDPADQVTGGISLSLRTPLGGMWNRITGQFQMQVALEGRYWLLDQYAPPLPPLCMVLDGHSGDVAIEPWVGILNGQAHEAIDPKTGDEILVISSFVLMTSPATPEFPTFSAGGGVTTTGPGEAEKKTYEGLDRCPAEKKSNKLTISIQPVFIKYGEGKDERTGTSFEKMKAKADEIWGQCCIEFEWKKAKEIEEPELADATLDELPTLITKEDEKSENKAIEVFFVRRIITDDDPPLSHHLGDGAAILNGDKVIVSDEAVDGCDPQSDGVLAHELGHACGGCLHDDAKPAAAGTVMEPTGKEPPNCPNQNSSVVKAVQCEKMRKSANATEKMPKTPCCQTHD